MANHDAGRTGILVVDMEDWSMNGYTKLEISISEREYREYLELQHAIELFDRISRVRKYMGINDARMIFGLEPLPTEPVPPWDQEFDPGESPEAEY